MDYEILYQRLTSYAGLSALTGLRWYPLHLPQKPTLPAGTYQVVSSVPVGETAGLLRNRVQFNCWGSTFVQARAVAVQLVAALDGFVDGDQATKLKASWLDNSIDLYEPETGLYVVPVDVMMVLS